MQQVRDLVEPGTRLLNMLLIVSIAPAGEVPIIVASPWVASGTSTPSPRDIITISVSRPGA